MKGCRTDRNGLDSECASVDFHEPRATADKTTALSRAGGSMGGTEEESRVWAEYRCIGRLVLMARS